MKDRLVLLAYGTALVTFTSIHQPGWLLVGLVLVLAAAGTDAPRLARRALVSVAVFALSLSLAYGVIGLIQDDLSLRYLTLLNLRVFLLTLLTFVIVERINLARALSFSPDLSFLLTLATSQILTLRRVVANFRLALASRTLGRLTLRSLLRQRAVTAHYFLDKVEDQASEAGQAMRSRGFFLD
jgi:cobalt/nickel transport system permease protein